jgi:hypothetical protein
MMELTDLCRELNNYFTVGKIGGTWTISSGVLDLSSVVNSGRLQDGQYFRISGSIFNDGVWQYSSNTPNDMKDETFNGFIWPMAVPKEIDSLLADVNAWIAKYNGSDSLADSPFQSESFGGYSYSKATGGTSSTGGSADFGTWQNAFRSRLNLWRKDRMIRS